MDEVVGEIPIVINKGFDIPCGVLAPARLPKISDYDCSAVRLGQKIREK